MNTQSQLKELLRLEEKIFVQGACYFINVIPIFIKKIYVRKEKRSKCKK
jgi:hypothetical protein